MIRRALFGATGFAIVLAIASPSSSAIFVMPRPAPQLRSDIVEPSLVLGRNASCESCHAEVAAEWQTSRHRAAFTNDAFRASLAREPAEDRAFCRGCHAPEAPPDLATEDVRHGIGVACITCHVPLGPVLAGEGTSTTPVPHGLVRTSAFSGTDACASCHSFSFPDRAMGPMQRTIAEHEKSGGAASCQSCHMPAAGSGESAHRSHAFRGGYDEPFVRGALAITATRTADQVEVVLTPRGVTHAVPTGDLFRRLVVEVKVGERVVSRYLARHFARERRMTEVRDDRVHLVPSTVAFPLAPTEAKALVSWRVVYQRVASQPSDDPAHAVVESEFEIARGTVAP